MLNRIEIIGHLGADPEMRYTQGGTGVCNLRVATSERWTDRDGAKQERTEWHSVSVWGKQGENVAQYVHKGSKVYVSGRLQSREYDDKEGVKRKVWEIQADNVVFLDSKADSTNVAERGGDRQESRGQGGGKPRDDKPAGGQGGGDWGGGGRGGQQGGGGRPAGGAGAGGGRGGGNSGGAGGFDDPIPF